MNQFNNYEISRENTLSQSRGGRYNPARVLRWSFGKKLYRAVLSMGNSDDYDVFREGDSIIVICRNTGLGYVGIEVFPINPGGEPDTAINSTGITVNHKGEAFFQNASEDLDTDKWEDWSLRYLAKVMIGYAVQ